MALKFQCSYKTPLRLVNHGSQGLIAIQEIESNLSEPQNMSKYVEKSCLTPVPFMISLIICAKSLNNKTVALDIDGLVHFCSIAIANALDKLRSGTKSSILWTN